MCGPSARTVQSLSARGRRLRGTLTLRGIGRGPSPIPLREGQFLSPPKVRFLISNRRIGRRGNGKGLLASRTMLSMRSLFANFYYWRQNRCNIYNNGRIVCPSIIPSSPFPAARTRTLIPLLASMHGPPLRDPNLSPPRLSSPF